MHGILSVRHSLPYELLVGPQVDIVQRHNTGIQDEVNYIL